MNNDAIATVQRNSIVWDYKYQLLSFMREYETLEEYERKIEAIKRRMEYSTELFGMLDKKRAADLLNDFESELERNADRIHEHKRFLACKAQHLMESVDRVKSLGFEVNTPALKIAEQFLSEK